MSMTQRYAGYIEREAHKAATTVKAEAMRQAARHMMMLDDEIKQLRAVADAAALYYEHYMQDEADDVDACVCGIEQHECAVSLREALRKLQPNYK